MKTTRRQRSRGISTAEVLAGSVLSLMTLAVLSSFFQAQQRTTAMQDTYTQSQTITRTVLDLVSREIRMATYDPSGLALGLTPGPCCPGFNQGIIAATPTSIHFRQDLNGDGDVLDAGEDVTYALGSNQVTRTDGANAAVALVTGVPSGGLSFTYWNNGNPPAQLVPSGSPAALTACQLACVAKVQVSITANLPNPNPRITTPVVSTAESQVAIRNRSLVNF